MNTHKLIAVCLTAAIVAACSSSSVPEPKHSISYQCAQGRNLYVHSGEEHAHVDFKDKHYELARRSSGIGLRYTSSEATLIIDGDSAVFVNHKNVELQTCRAVI